MNINLQFIADKVNVSPSLVSQVLNNKDVRVSEQTKKKIIKTAQKYNYTPNRMAASLRTKKTDTIALILPFAYIEFFGKLIYYVQTTARELGYSVLVCNTFENESIEKKYLELYRSNMIDGIIVAPLSLDNNVQQYKNINELNFPIVFIDRYFPNLSTSYVCTDNAEGAYQGVRQLVNVGCRKIYLMYREQLRPTTIYKDRKKGCKRAMLEAGVPENELVEVPFSFDGEKSDIYERLSGLEEPDAIFIMSSSDLCDLYDACIRQQYESKRIRFMVFDNYSLPNTVIKNDKLMEYAKSPVIIVDQNPEKMGKDAVELLVKKINGEKSQSSILLEPKIFVE